MPRPGAEDTEAALLARLRAGEEAAFRALVRARHARLLRLAGAFLRNRASAEEVVQETWLAVITGLDSYAGQAPLAAWINGILVNKARTRAVRDGRSIAFSDLAREEGADETPAPERFLPDGHWAERFTPWDSLTPEREAGDRQLLAGVAAALDALPPAQRAVVLLRDVEGLDSPAICRALEISEANLRVLLHRARLKLRDAADRLVRA
jgi:RNA polymerase sigma-70 factor, ECF subfamily